MHNANHIRIIRKPTENCDSRQILYIFLQLHIFDFDVKILYFLYILKVNSHITNKKYINHFRGHKINLCNFYIIFKFKTHVIEKKFLFITFYPNLNVKLCKLLKVELLSLILKK